MIRVSAHVIGTPIKWVICYNSLAERIKIRCVNWACLFLHLQPIRHAIGIGVRIVWIGANISRRNKDTGVCLYGIHEAVTIAIVVRARRNRAGGCSYRLRCRTAGESDVTTVIAGTRAGGEANINGSAFDRPGRADRDAAGKACIV